MEALADNEFDAKVKNAKGFVLIDFWAPWCGPCKNLMPLLQEVLPKFPQLKAFSMNIDDNPETPSAHSIMSIPTLILFKDGEVHNTRVGSFPSTAEIENWLNKELAA